MRKFSTHYLYAGFEKLESAKINSHTVRNYDLVTNTTNNWNIKQCYYLPTLEIVHVPYICIL